jgi:predicted Zn-dependent protease
MQAILRLPYRREFFNMMKKYIKIPCLGFSVIGLVLWVISCAVNPVTGRQELMLLSESEELDLGRETDAEIIKEYGVLQDPKLTAYLNDFCQRLGQVSHRPKLSYRFKVVDASVVNAFAVPGGQRIYRPDGSFRDQV